MDLSEYFASEIKRDTDYLKEIHAGFQSFFVCGLLGLTEKNINTHNIDVIVSLTKNKILSIQNFPVVLFHYSAEDLTSFDISQHFDSMYNDLRPHLSKNILFHCNEGKSRSVSALISVVLNIICNKMSANRCYTDMILKRIKQTRIHAQPNDGFMQQLYMYENKCKKREIL